MRLRLPTNLKIGARTIKVRTCKRSARLADADGEFDPNSGTIRIRAGLSPERRLQVAVEESLHAVEDDRSLDVPHRDIEQLALGLAALIVDNELLPS